MLRSSRHLFYHAVVSRPESIPRTSLAPGFSLVLRRHARSAAYAELAERVQGFPGPGFSLLDAEQLAEVTGALGASPGDRLADLGCGLGLVAERLAASVGGSGARIVGIDLAVGALGAAHRRFDGAHFAAADLVRLPIESARLDGLVAVDSLYFLPDPALDRAVSEGARVLAPGGRFVVLASELVPADGQRPPERTRLGRALQRAGLTWSARDLTALEHAFWRRRGNELPRLEARFAAEGCRDLWQALADETRRGVTWSREGRVRRYLFRATRTGGAAPAGPSGGEPSRPDSR